MIVAVGVESTIVSKTQGLERNSFTLVHLTTASSSRSKCGSCCGL